MKSHSTHNSLGPDVDASLRGLPSQERRALERAWTLADHAGPVALPHDASRKAAVWARLTEMTNAEDRRPQPGSARLRLVRQETLRWMAAAASIVLLIGIGVGYWFLPLSLTSPNGATAQLHLSDGSLVQLNAGSTIEYRRHFWGERRVSLEGEAFFTVEKSNEPFVVETFNATTRVLGTEFNVRARPDDDEPSTSVVVASGTVRLSPIDGDDEGVILTAGLHSEVPAGRAIAVHPDSVLVDRALLWRVGGLAFSDQPLGTIFNELERRYEVHIQAESSIRDLPYSFWVHEPRSVEGVLADVTQAQALRYRKTANGYEVYRP